MPSDLGSPEQNHLTMENEHHKETVSKVMNKWLGEGFPERCNEGQAARAAIKACAHLDSEAKSVAPKGQKFSVEYKALSDRAVKKYGGGNMKKSK